VFRLAAFCRVAALVGFVRFVGRVGLVGLVGCVGCNRDPPPSPPPPAPLPLEWVGIRYGAFPLQLLVPKEWHESARPIDPGPGVLCLGPEEEGFRPNVMLYWSDKPRDLEDYFGDEKSKRKGTIHPQKIMGEGSGVVAGMQARYLLYDSYEPRGDFRTMDWYFVGPRGHGLLRFTTKTRLFLKHQPLFDEMTRRVRVAP